MSKINVMYPNPKYILTNIKQRKSIKYSYLRSFLDSFIKVVHDHFSTNVLLAQLA